MKPTDTIVLTAKSSEAGEKIYTVAGLPLATALFYASLFAAAVWFYGVLWPSAPIMVSDSSSYLSTAQRLLDFHISQERTPGYPLLLVLTGSSHSPNRVLFFVSLLLHFASIWLLASVLYSAGLTEIMLNLFGLILVLPPYVEPAAYVLSENLAEVMLVAGFVSFFFWSLRKKIIWILISALTIGYAALTRPTYQFLVLALAGYILLVRFLLPKTALKWKDMITGSLILICGSVVILASYAFVNYRSFGYFGVSPKLGLTLSIKTVRFIERLPDEYAAIREALIRGRNSELVSEASHTGYMYIWHTIPELSKITGLKYPAELSDYMLRVNLLLIKKAPLQYLEEVVLAFGSYWFPPSTPVANFYSRPVQLLWAVTHFCLIGGFAFNLTVLVGAAIYIKRCKHFLPPGIKLPLSELRLIGVQGLIYGLAATMVFYTAAVSCLIEVGDPRYRVPTDSLIVFMLFLGTHLWWRLVDLSRTVFCPTQAHAV
jgi:hypothetical protein